MALFSSKYIRYDDKEEIANAFPDTIYKYRAWDNDFHKRILTDFEIFFSSPENLKDPYDCNLAYRYESMNSIEKIGLAERTLKGANEGNRKYRRKKARELAATPYMNDKEYLRKSGEMQLMRLRKNAGIFCASSNPKSNLMWSYYADSHKGFCIGFDTIGFYYDTNASLGNVIYQKDFPLLKPSTDRSFDIFRQLHTKSREWHHEEEIRLAHYHIKEEERVRKIRVSTLKTIIAGMRMPEIHLLEMAETVSKIGEASGYQIELLKVQQKTNSYELEFNKIQF